MTVSGYFAGKSDDSTFLGGADINFGNSLLLPNGDLVAGYAKMDVSGSYAFNRGVKWYVTVENFLDQRYAPAFGFPALPINARTGVTMAIGGPTITVTDAGVSAPARSFRLSNCWTMLRTGNCWRRTQIRSPW